MRKEISAGIIVYHKTQGGPEFLLLYKGKNYWNFPKGKLEGEKESSYKAALREVYEETGLGRGDLKFDPRFNARNSFFLSDKKRKLLKIVIFFLAETSNPVVRISSEHKGYAWLPYREALRLLTYQIYKNNLKKAYEIIRGKSVPSDKKGSSRESHHLQRNR